MSDQDTLNNLVSAFDTAIKAVAAEITGLQKQIAANVPPAALDFSGINTELANLQALVPPATTTPAPAAS